MQWASSFIIATTHHITKRLHLQVGLAKRKGLGRFPLKVGLEVAENLARGLVEGDSVTLARAGGLVNGAKVR